MATRTDREWWQHPAIFVAALAALGWCMNSFAGCESQCRQSHHKHQLQNNKARFAHDKWLLENGHTKEPRIR